VRGKTLMVAAALTAAVFAEAKPERESVMWRKIKATPAPLEVIGTLACPRSEEIADSNWSIGCDCLDRDYGKFDMYAKFLPEIGAKHARFGIGWAKCEKEKGKYDFAWLDRPVRETVKMGLKPWMTILYGNPIYGSGLRLGSRLKSVVRNEEAFAAWQRYIRAMAENFRDVIDLWEIWNEPWGEGEDYAELFVRGARVIREVQPKARFIVTSCHFPNDVTKVAERLKRENALDLATYWAVHPYMDNPDASYTKERGEDCKYNQAIERLVKLLADYSPDWQIFQGECGCPAQLEWDHALSDYPWTEISQAKWYLRRMAGDAVRGMKSNIFTMMDLQYFNMLQSFGMIRSNAIHQFVYRRPCFWAVRNMMTFFTSEVKSEGFAAAKASGARRLDVAKFEKVGRPVLLVWQSDRVPDDGLDWERTDVFVPGVKMADPVWVDLMTGRVCALPAGSFVVEAGGGTRFTELPVHDAPVMVAECAAVPLQ